MKKAIGVFLSLASVAVLIWTIYSDWKGQKAVKEKRLDILEKAREAKAEKALERNLESEIIE